MLIFAPLFVTVARASRAVTSCLATSDSVPSTSRVGPQTMTETMLALRWPPPQIVQQTPRRRLLERESQTGLRHDHEKARPTVQAGPAPARAMEVMLAVTTTMATGITLQEPIQGSVAPSLVGQCHRSLIPPIPWPPCNSRALSPFHCSLACSLASRRPAAPLVGRRSCLPLRTVERTEAV